MSDDKVAEAVDIVAHHLICQVVEDELGEQWGMYPDLYETDWYAVDERVTEILERLRPRHEAYLAAYDYLEHRFITGSQGTVLMPKAVWVDGEGLRMVDDVPLPE